MSKYNFDKLIDRTHSACVKYDLRPLVFGKSDVIPMWVADMDFETPDFIREAVIQRANHPIYGYTFRDKAYYQPIMAWMESHHQWTVQKDEIVFCPGVVPALNFGVLAFTVASLMAVISQPIGVSVVTNFTWFVPAQQEMLVYGFFTMTMIGAIYYIAPRLAPVAGTDLLLGKASFLLCAVGVLFYVVPLAVGGIIQGTSMNDATVPFLNVVKGSLMPIRASSLGELLMILGNALFLLNLILMLFRFFKSSVTVFLAGENKAVGVVA